MEAAAAAPVRKKVSTWKWVVGILIAGVIAFLALGRSEYNKFEEVVRAELQNPRATLEFGNVRLYKTGAQCGTVRTSPGDLFRFVVVKKDAFIDDGRKFPGGMTFNQVFDQACRD